MYTITFKRKGEWQEIKNIPLIGFAVDEIEALSLTKTEFRTLQVEDKNPAGNVTKIAIEMLAWRRAQGKT